MTRDELAHILRAASAIAGDGEILVVGSQAILASYDEEDLPDTATMSIEADLIFPDDPERTKADEVEGTIGELSDFHRLHLIYAQTVGFETVTLPSGWDERAEIFDRPDTGIARARCLEPHDLVVAKLVAGRPKDLSFATVLVQAGLVSPVTLRVRARALPSTTDPDAVINRIAIEVEDNP